MSETHLLLPPNEWDVHRQYLSSIHRAAEWTETFLVSGLVRLLWNFMTQWQILLSSWTSPSKTSAKEAKVFASMDQRQRYLCEAILGSCLAFTAFNVLQWNRFLFKHASFPFFFLARNLLIFLAGPWHLRMERMEKTARGRVWVCNTCVVALFQVLEKYGLCQTWLCT